MKKTLLLVLIALFFAGCSNPVVISDDIGKETIIEDKVDSWKYFEDKEAGFSLEYPRDIIFNENSDELSLTIEVKNIDSLDDTMGFNKETALKNAIFLSNGEYGEKVDWPLNESMVVKNVDGLYAQQFIVLSRFEICDVTFQRKLYLITNNHQIVLTVKGNRDEVMESMPEYFEMNKENCGDYMIWNFDKQLRFYQAIDTNRGSTAAQEWYNIFDEIVNTIEIDIPDTSLELLEGEWVSSGDDKSSISFLNGQKIDLYDGIKVSGGNFVIINKEDGNYIISNSEYDVFEYKIISLSDDRLILSFLPRGNTLEYLKK